MHVVAFHIDIANISVCIIAPFYRILDHVGNVQVVEELIYVKYTQDDSQQKKSEIFILFTKVSD